MNVGEAWVGKRKETMTVAKMTGQGGMAEERERRRQEGRESREGREARAAVVVKGARKGKSEQGRRAKEWRWRRELG